MLRQLYRSLSLLSWSGAPFRLGGAKIPCRWSCWSGVCTLDEIAYCSNQRNDDTISIECCHSDDTGQFSQDTLDALVQLLNWLIKTYELGRDDILRHYDVIGKECPYYFVKHPVACCQGLFDTIHKIFIFRT